MTATPYPGSEYHYSNTNYQLLGVMLEQATGVSLADLLAKRISEPLALQHTSLAPYDSGAPEFRGEATDLQTRQLIDATDDLLAFGNGGSGGVITTAPELTWILTAIVHRQILPDPLRDAMQAPTIQSADSYGLGLATYQLECGTFLGHEGRVNGTASIALVDASTPDRSVVIALNRSSGESLVDLAEPLICSTDSTSRIRGS